MWYNRRHLGPGLRNLTPHYWALQGFTDVMARGIGVSRVWLHCVILLGFAIVTLVIGVTRSSLSNRRET
jgi:ABC-2 type transport system permease protein